MDHFLHGIGGEESPIETGDSLISPPKENYDLVLTDTLSLGRRAVLP